MLQLMESVHFGKVEDFAEEEYGPMAKRSRVAGVPLNQWSSTNHELQVPPSLYNPLDEPSPLGLRLKKSPSLLDLIQMRLSQGSSTTTSVASSEIVDSETKKDVKGIAAFGVNDKLKASNFPAFLLRIGSWEYISKYEGDLVVKCYFAKHKLVWEVLEGHLKSKIEIQWSDIAALKAECSDNGPGTLTIVLARQPAFFRETNPQPRKHTLWQATSDFTDGQASKHKVHYVQCPPGVMNKHYEKLIQCDVRLGVLSRQPELVMDSPYFELQASAEENLDESKSDRCDQLPAGAKGLPSPMSNDTVSSAYSFNLGHTFVAAQHVATEVPSPSSVMDTCDDQDSEGRKSLEGSELISLSNSMSTSDLVNHIGNCIFDQITPGSLPSEKASECQNLLENITQVLLSDTQPTTGLDEKSLMKRVNSLCCLLQDPDIASSAQVDGENRGKSVSFDFMNNSTHEKGSNVFAQVSEENFSGSYGREMVPMLTRKDSVGDLLLNLPRIASCPKFLWGIAENDE